MKHNEQNNQTVRYFIIGWKATRRFNELKDLVERQELLGYQKEYDIYKALVTERRNGNE